MKTAYVIQIMLKTGISDPQGAVVQQSLHALGYEDVEDVRLARLVAFTSEGNETDVDIMCKELLVNPVMEDYKIITQIPVHEQ